MDHLFQKKPLIPKRRKSYSIQVFLFIDGMDFEHYLYCLAFEFVDGQLSLCYVILYTNTFIYLIYLSVRVCVLHVKPNNKIVVHFILTLFIYSHNMWQTYTY